MSAPRIGSDGAPGTGPAPWWFYGGFFALKLALGRQRGLPPAASGHNKYWFWGTRGRRADPVIVVGGTPEEHADNWDSVTLVTRTDCGYCMPYENGNAVMVLRGARTPVAREWPRLRHYD